MLAGIVGDRGHRIHGVFGDTVNLGSRLEGQAPAGGVVIAAMTRERLPEDVRVRPLPPLQVKGKSEPVVAYVLEGLVETSSAGDSPPTQAAGSTSRKRPG